MEQKYADLKVHCDEITISGKKAEIEFNEINRWLSDAQSVAGVGSWETDLSNFEVNYNY